MLIGFRVLGLQRLHDHDGLKRFKLGFHLIVLFQHLLQLIRQLRMRLDSEFFDSRIQYALHFMDPHRDLRTGDGGNPFYPGSDGFLAGDSETADILGIRHVGSSAKLNGHHFIRMIGYLHDTDLIAVFILEERFGSPLGRLIERHLVHFDGIRVINHLVDILLDLMDLFGRQNPVRIEVEPEIILINERTSLLGGLEDLPKLGMQQMRSGMRAHLGVSLALFYDKFHAVR